MSQSDAIVIARVLQVRSVLEEPPFHPLSLHYLKVTIRPIRWLKGSQGPADLHLEMIPMMDEAVRDIPHSTGAQEAIRVFFLRRSPRGWMISDYPGGYKAGRLLVLVEPMDDTAETRAIKAMVARQSLDSLLLRADLVVLGHRVARGRVRVDSVLLGRAPADTIHAGSPVASSIDSGPAVYFLSRVSSNRYETIDFRAGCDPVRADTLARLGVPLRQVFQRAAELRPRQEGRGGARP